MQHKPAMLDENALVHNLSQKSKTGFKEELYIYIYNMYSHPRSVVPAMLDKTTLLDKNALAHNLSQKSNAGFKEELYNGPE